jgi:hypothetical protein
MQLLTAGIGMCARGACTEYMAAVPARGIENMWRSLQSTKQPVADVKELDLDIADPHSPVRVSRCTDASRSRIDVHGRFPGGLEQASGEAKGGMESWLATGHNTRMVGSGIDDGHPRFAVTEHLPCSVLRTEYKLKQTDRIPSRWRCRRGCSRSRDVARKCWAGGKATVMACQAVFICCDDTVSSTAARGGRRPAADESPASVEVVQLHIT